jgi:hypothetical protein
MGHDTRPWIDLWDAMLYVVSAADDGERLVGLMPPKRHPWIDNHIDGQFPEAKRELNDACKLLTGILRTGRIAGIGRGARDADPALRPITDLEWQTRFVHFAKSELHPPFGAEPGELPAVLGVLVKREDVERECSAACAADVGQIDNQVVAGKPPELQVRIRRRATKQEATAEFFRGRFPEGRPAMSNKELAHLVSEEAPEIGKVSVKTIERASAIWNNNAAPNSVKQRQGSSGAV